MRTDTGYSRSVAGKCNRHCWLPFLYDLKAQVASQRCWQGPGVEGLTFRPGSHRREVLRANGRRLAFTWCEIDCIVTAVAAEAGVRHQITRSPAIPHQL